MPATSRMCLRFVQRHRPQVYAGTRSSGRATGAISHAPGYEPRHRQDLRRRTRAETARRLQRVLETNGDMPPIQHDRGRRQRLALQPPQPGITIAKHRRRRVSVHPGRGERLLERFGRGRLAVAGEGEAVLGAIGVDHLARAEAVPWAMVSKPRAA